MGRLLELTRLRKSFGSLTVINDLSCQLDEGEALGVIGPNGAGKTTLFNLITGVLPLDSGDIRLGGRDISRLPAAARCRAGIGRSFQIPRPFGGMTVYENCLVAATFGNPDQSQSTHTNCLDVLERTGLIKKANTPAGSLTLLDRKRLELARALATRPRLLCLDEIAGGLTDTECAELVKLIKQVHREGTAIIWIEHIVHALLAVVERLVVLNYGEKIAEGEPHSVMASAEVQEIYVGLEATA